MGYDAAILKAWQCLEESGAKGGQTVRFLADTYEVSVDRRAVVSLSCNAPAKDFAAILIVHYLAKRTRGLPACSGEWLTFREITGIEGYYAAFKQRAVQPIVRKYGKRPWALAETSSRLGAKQAVEDADAAVVIEPFDGVPILIKLWGADDEFGPDAALFFDRSIKTIFCTEDIIVLAQLVAASL